MIKPSVMIKKFPNEIVFITTNDLASNNIFIYVEVLLLLLLLLLFSVSVETDFLNFRSYNNNTTSIYIFYVW